MYELLVSKTLMKLNECISRILHFEIRGNKNKNCRHPAFVSWFRGIYLFVFENASFSLNSVRPRGDKVIHSSK